MLKIDFITRLNMRKKFYIFIISIISLITITTAFIPIQKSADNKNKRNDIESNIHDHPEAGYIEEIGN